MKMSVLAGLAVAFGFAANNGHHLNQVVQGSLDSVREIASKFELRNLHVAIANEIIANNQQEVERDFPEFVRKISYSDIKDVTLEHWGTQYRLESQVDGYEIISSGKDRTAGTANDFSVTIPFP